jgi:uncharacterized protein involved in response to NO
LGRLALWFSASLPPGLVALADLVFLPVLGSKLAAQLMVRPKPQQMVFLLALGLLWAGNLACHLEWMGVLRDGVGPGLRAGLLTLVAMIAILGGRVTPGFTRNAMVGCGPRDRPAAQPRPLAAAAIARRWRCRLRSAGAARRWSAALALIAGGRPCWPASRCGRGAGR